MFSLCRLLLSTSSSWKNDFLLNLSQSVENIPPTIQELILQHFLLHFWKYKYYSIIIAVLKLSQQLLLTWSKPISSIPQSCGDSNDCLITLSSDFKLKILWLCSELIVFLSARPLGGVFPYDTGDNTQGEVQEQEVNRSLAVETEKVWVLFLTAAQSVQAQRAVVSHDVCRK